jgi:rod shape determining protein RodA
MADYAGHVPARPRSRRRAEVASVSAFLRRLDWVLVLAVAGLVAFGLWAISGITRFDVPGDPDYQLVRQSIAVGVGVVALLLALVTPLTVLRRHWRVFYAVTLGLMVLVFAYAEAIRGSKRWLEIGPFQFQPSEFGKVCLVIALAGFLVERGSRITSMRTVLAAVGLAAVPTVLVFLQPDLGTAMVYAAALAAVLLIAGTRWKHLAVLLSVTALLVLSIVWLLPAAGVEVLKPYQTARLTGFTNPDEDPAGLTYNVKQSITAIGAGGIDGRGVTGASQTRLAYLPEHATDFVFASLAEQRGFFGAAILLLLYMLVVWRGLRVITVAGDLFSAMLAAGIVFAFLFQLFVNVGMTMGIAPITGIPLPFVSVGGSSIVANLLAMGLLLSIHARGRLLSARR